MRKPWIAALLTLACTPSLGCTPYRMVGTPSEGAPKLAIVTLENDSVEPGVEVVVTRALRQGFLRRGATRLVSDPGVADVVLRGKVLPLRTVSTSFSTVALAIEYTVRMELEVELKMADGDVVRVDREATRGSELYLSSADVEATRKNRQEALRRISDVLAARIHDALNLYLGDRTRAAEEGSS